MSTMPQPSAPSLDRKGLPVFAGIVAGLVGVAFILAVWMINEHQRTEADVAVVREHERKEVMLATVVEQANAITWVEIRTRQPDKVTAVWLNELGDGVLDLVRDAREKNALIQIRTAQAVSLIPADNIGLVTVTRRSKNDLGEWQMRNAKASFSLVPPGGYRTDATH